MKATLRSRSCPRTGKIYSRIIPLAALAGLLAMLAPVAAQAESGKEKAKAAPSASKETVKSESGKGEAVELTGSRLKQKGKTIHRSTTTSLNVTVIDRRQIEQSGAMTVKEVLRHYPFAR